MSVDAYASDKVRNWDTVLLKVASHRSLDDRVCAVRLREVHVLLLLIRSSELGVCMGQSPASVHRCFYLIYR